MYPQTKEKSKNRAAALHDRGETAGRVAGPGPEAQGRGGIIETPMGDIGSGSRVGILVGVDLT